MNIAIGEHGMNIELILIDILKIYDKEIFYISTGGKFLVSTITHGGTVAMSKLIIAGASPGAALIHQKNRGNIGARTERSRWEIIRDMLTVLTEDKKSKKTRIMQRACLDWRNFQRYFNFLLEENFIKECDNPELGIYELTENGKELLKRLKVVGEMLH